MSQQQFGKNFEKGVEATSLVPGGGVAKTRSDRKHGGTESARSLAQVYRNKLIEGKDQLQVAAARELFRYVNGDLKDEPPEFIESFLSTLDGRTEAGAQSAVYNATKSASIEQKKAGIFMIVCLADHQGLIRYANYLLKMLNSGGMDEETVKMGCRALAYLIMTSKTYAAELVDRCMDHCTEWLQFPDDRVSLLDENRRLAAVHLSRELAIFTPTAFFLRANLFFKYIFNALRDKSPTIRIAAIEALHSVLTIISQREAKQKTEWYKECFDEAFNIEKGETPRDEQDRYHSVAVLLNELLRISDQAYEHVRIESSKFEKPQKPHDDPITWIVLHRYSDTVESVTSRQLVKENFKDIIGCIRKIIEVVARKSKGGGGATTQKNLYLTTVLMQLLPRVCAFSECDANFRALAFETAFNSLNKLPIAAPAVGMMMLSNPELHKSYIPQVIGYVTNALKKSLDQADFYFTFLFLFVDAYNQEITEQIKSLLPILLDLPLSRGLTNVLKMIMMRIPKLRLNVQDGVMASVYLNLTGVPVPPKSEPAGRPPPPRNILQKAMNDQKELDKVVLSIDTLGEFYFSRGALQRIMQYVADYYLVAENVEIRMAAVKCCCDMIVPFMRVYKKVTTDKRHHLLATIHGVLRALVSLIVVDPHVDVRMQVIRCFSGVSHQFLVHLAQPEMLEVQFMALHDEKLEMQQACVTLLGRLAELNPALVFPRMRRMLLETLSQLTHSGQPRLEQHSAKMIAQIANQSPKFLRPYIGSMLAALIPKLRSELKYADVTTHVLNAISELSVIGGAELVKNINPLFSKLTQMINDSGNLQRREAALRAIGGICRSTAYVVDPYKDFPTLLDDLLKLLKTVMSSSIRRECIKTLGILGAIDPYTHKVFTGSVQSAYAISTALALPISLSDASDPRQDIIQWVNYEKCTLDEFYPAITIANLMMMMQNEDSQSYPEIAQAIVTIFRSLGDAAPQYVEQVVPRLIEVCRTINSRTNQAFLRDFFLRQLSKFVEIIKQHALPYMPDIFSIIADAWKEDVAVKMCVVSVLEEMGTALGADFSAYTGELIPYLLNVLHTDKTKERYLTIKVLEVMRPLCSCLVQHLHLVLPPVLIILDDVSIALKVRITALETILHMAKNVDISAYAPRMMQSWHHCIGTFELREKLLLLLIEIIKKLGKHFDVFARSVEIKLREHGLDRSDNFDHYKKLSQRAQMSRDIITTSLFGAQNQGQNGNGVGFGGGAIFLGNVGLHERLMNGSLESSGSGTEVKEDYYTEEHPVGDSRVPTAARSTMDIPDVVITKQRVNHEMFNAAWRNDNLTSKDEWMQWLYKLRIAFLKCGSSPSLRAASSLADQYPHLARDLFPAVFMSIWTEVGSKGQDDLALAMRKALDTGYSDVIQTVLNLAEFMDHSEKGPLPIDYNILGKCAEKTKAYAKACRYKENEINNRWDLKKEEFAAEKKKREEQGLERPENLPNIKDVNVLRADDCQALITFANKLNVQEEAAGVVRYAESHNMNINMPGRWYEKLNEWEKALHAYEVDTSTEDTTMHEMRCLEALAKWEQLNEKAKLAKENAAGRQMEHKVAVIAARGAWAVDDWPSMAGYVSHISENTQDGAMLRAIVAVHNNEFPKAMGLIEKVRDMFDSELTAMASESYERAYTPMVFVQQMAELEEAIEFKLRPERRPRIALLWSRRLQGCRQNVEQWQRLLMLRSLVLTPQEMHPLRVKFASLCRKQGKTAMSREVLRELLNLAPGTSLLEAKVPQEKPQLVLALCKQLWQDEHREEALRTLEHLAKQFQKIHRNIEEQEKLYLHSQEAARICAKVFLKLGEWNEIHYKNRPPHEISGILIQNTMYRNNDAQKTINYYRTATQYDPKWHKAWHKLASSYFYATMKDAPRKSIMRRSPMGPPPPPNLPLGGFGAMNYPFNPIAQPDFPHPAPLGSLAGIPTMPSQTSPIMQHVTGFSGPLTNTNIENAMSAIFCFSKALFFAPGSRLEDTLRLLQLWFDYGHEEEVYGKLVENVTDLPITTWLEVVPQLMARLDSSDKEKPTQLIIKVLVEISKYKPQSLIYAVCVAARSTDANRQRNALSILEKMSDYHAELVKEAKMVTEELVRCAILWHEKWHDALDEASRVYFHRSLQDNNVKSMYEALKDLPKNVVQGTPKTMKEHSFNQTYQSDLLEAQRYCHAYECEHNIKDLNQAWEIYCQIFKRLRDQLVNLTLLDLNYVSPELVRARDLQLAVPGTYDPSSEPVGIASFSTKMTVITSKQRPRKMVIRGSNGLEYQFLLKGHEDPRQDERVMQLFGLVNTLLANNSETCRRNLTIQRYAIIALSKDSGLIGWVPNCDTLHSLVKEYREKKAKISLSLEHKALQKMSSDTEHLTVMQKLQCFESALAATKGDDLRQILWLKSPSSEVWFDRRTNYTRSVACMSMVGYILGLGDRHPSNLMLDRLTGKIVHIDFGDCFEVAMLREKFPERVPFRLTRMLINAMEITGLEGVYRYTAERVLKVLRTNQESLLAVLEAFVYDPVINWRLVEGMKRDPKVRKDPSRMNTNQAPSSSTTEGTMDTIKRKLAGTEFVNIPLSENPEPLPVTQQLERLIEQATCNMNLCQSYIGWCPFW